MNVGIFAAQAARRFAERAALVYGVQRWSFAAFDAAADSVATGLLTAGLKPGARVGLFMSNRPEYMLLQFALERAGLVRVPLNARFTANEVALILGDCAASAVFYDSATADRVAQAHVELPEPTWTCSVDEEAADGGPVWSALVDTEAQPDRLCRAQPEDLCSLNYTSGTTGRPKGAMLSHRNWIAVYRNMLVDRDMREDDVVAHIGPLSHASGSYFTPWLLRGATNVIVPGGRLEDLFETISQLGVTVFTCVPTVLTRIVNHPDIDHYDLSSLRAIGYGAEPIPHNTMKKALQRFGAILTQNYGLTEAYMTCCILRPEEHFLPTDVQNSEPRMRVGSIGRPYTFVEVVLRDERGYPVPPDEVGEITIRSEHVMKGYWGLPEETRKVLRDGWLYSGDLARMDESGFITLVGRSKEMLISGGFNIYPHEIEAVLTSHPKVMEAAVIGVPDPEWGEVATAYVVASPNAALSEETLVSFCKPLLGFKTPKRWTIIDRLPKNPNGKIDKQALRAATETSPAGGNHVRS
jgi:acyl-CoA synthetase (AMP-forming)/AMP-acid ligase II